MMKRNYNNFTEEVKVESVLKWRITGPALAKLKLLRIQIIKNNPEAKPIPDKDLHVTLAAGDGWKSIKHKFRGLNFDEPTHRVDFELPKKITKKDKTSWYVKCKNQEDWKDYVTDLLQGSPDSGRVFHVTLANLTGSIGDSVAVVPEEYNRDYKKEYNKFQSSNKMKRYRAELNKFNREKGTYGNRDGKDASHRNGKIVGFEDEGANRGRREKSRLPGSKRNPVNE